MSIGKRFTLEGKMALVTGGSRGIGRAIALVFAEAGADVAVSSRRLADLDKVADEVRGLGRRSLAVAAHGGKPAELAQLVDKVKAEFGRIDILVNNAAANPVFGPILDLEERAWDMVMDVNLKGYFLLSRAVAKMMIARGGGSIINMASAGGIIPDKGIGAYCVSKAGVIMLTKVMASEWAQFNIRVNAIAPGVIQTKMSQALWDRPEHYKDVVTRTPLSRIGQPDEIAGAALYLASGASSFMTGETLVLDGGASISKGL